MDVKNAEFLQNCIASISENVFFLQGMLLIFAPAISGDWLSSEANKLKLVLHDWLIEERGKYGLWLFIYIKSRETKNIKSLKLFPLKNKNVQFGDFFYDPMWHTF